MTAWIAVIAGFTVTNTLLLWVLYFRIRAAESFLMILSGVILQQASIEALAEYLKSRSDHPAGKRKRGNGIPDATE